MRCLDTGQSQRFRALCMGTQSLLTRDIFARHLLSLLFRQVILQTETANDSRDDPEVRVEGTPSVVDLISGDNCESIEGVAAGLVWCSG